jgi:hypothetical protein
VIHGPTGNAKAPVTVQPGILVTALSLGSADHGVTVSVAVPDLLTPPQSNVAVIVVVATLTPVARPPLEMVAIEVDEEIHAADAVTSSVVPSL